MMLKMKKHNKKGFTLIELIVVMAILAILVALGAPRFLGYTKDANVTAMQADSKIIEQASYQYALKNDDAWPVKVNAGADGTVGTADDVVATVTLDDNVKSIVAQALVEKGVAADASAASNIVNNMVTVNAFCEIDESAIQPFIRSTKNPISDYFIVNRVSGVTGYNNELEGMVFSKNALTDSEGHLNSGLFDNQAD